MMLLFDILESNKEIQQLIRFKTKYELKQRNPKLIKLCQNITKEWLEKESDTGDTQTITKEEV